MKRLFVVLVAIVFGCGIGQSQEIKEQDIEAQDLALVLKSTGHHIFGFDLSE